MIIRKKYIPFFLLLLFMVVFTTMTSAQRKKKSSESPIASVRLREAEFYFTEGEKYFILEDYAKALIYYQKTLEINPENATVHYKIAEVLSLSEKQEDLVKATLSIEEALSLERKNKYYYLLAARIYSNLTRFDQAAQTYETMLREVSGTEEYLYELAAVYQYANKPEEAIKVYNRAEAYFGINETTALQKQRIYFDLGKNEEAFKEGEKLIKAFPEEEQFIVGFAEILSQYGFKEKAIPLLEKFITENTIAPSASMLLAGLYRDTNRENQARELLRNLFNNPDVDLSSKLIVLGTYNAEINQNKEKKQSDPAKEKFVLELYTKLEKDYPEHPNVAVLGGDLYLSLGKNTEAQQHYLRAVDAGANSFEVWQNLLYLELRLEQYENVVRHAERAIEYFPNQAMLHYFNGLACLRTRKYKDAINSMEQAKKLSASNAAMLGELNSLLGDAYNSTREYDKSDKAYDEALAFNPNNDVVLNNYSYFLAIRKSNLEKAEKMSAQLIKNNPENATYLDTYAWVLYSREKYKEAKKVMEKAINSGMASATHYEHFGDILFKLGEVERAVQQWEKAKSMLSSSNETLNKKIANRKIYE
ncbi:MAG TPA: tetratricopeptide repeat protein [Cyclobacteriaceae bacterium]|nr:tetratricopeptide repeat protein [Cyclobacteriaceae bacterium]